MRAKANCPECHGNGKVMLLFGPSPCKTCGGNSPSEWKCNPLDLLAIGRERKATNLRGELATRAGTPYGLSVEVPTYECVGAPWQPIPRLRALGAAPSIDLGLTFAIHPRDDEKVAWEEQKLTLQEHHIGCVIVTIRGTSEGKNLEAVLRFMEEGTRCIGNVFWHLILAPS